MVANDSSDPEFQNVKAPDYLVQRNGILKTDAPHSLYWIANRPSSPAKVHDFSATRISRAQFSKSASELLHVRHLFIVSYTWYCSCCNIVPVSFD